MARSGQIIVLEGIDGVGKSTQAQRLTDYLKENGYAAYRFSALGKDDHLREIAGRLVKSVPTDHAAIQIFFAFCRLSRLTQISKHLADGALVVCDRYKHSSLVYGIAAGLDETWCRSLERLLPEPDLVLLLDLDEEVAASRSGRSDELESDVEMQRRCRSIYRKLSLETPSWRMVDASDSEQTVFSHITETVHEILSNS